MLLGRTADHGPQQAMPAAKFLRPIPVKPWRRLPAAILLLALGVTASRSAQADEMTWTLTSNYEYRVQVEFYSQSRPHEWPGGGKAYDLNDYARHAFSLNCIRGEKICYGAWVSGRGDLYWGVGLHNRHTCRNCCGICGEDDPALNLRD